MVDPQKWSVEELAEHVKVLISFIQTNFKKPNGEKILNKDIAEAIHCDPAVLSRVKNADLAVTKGSEILEAILNAYSVEPTGWKAFRKMTSPEDDDRLLLLANKLALNLVDVSVSFAEKEEPHRMVIQNEKTLSLRKREPQRERFIAVVGAGASHAATRGLIPTSEETIRQIRERIRDKPIQDLIEKELDRLRLTYRLDPKNFETQLLAFSKYDREAVLDGLTEICGVRYLPSLAYEILAHMFKHRFIDVIVNFNYDEVLDLAIKEEVASGDYEYIYSDGHCPDRYENFLIESRLKQPVYIKPHGTISHRSSLRFTQEDYFNIPMEIRNTLYDLVEGRVKTPGANSRLAINFLVLGFGMESFEFIEIIRKYLKENPEQHIHLWIFDTKTSLKDFNLSLEDELLERIHPRFFDLHQFDLENYLRVLWCQIEKNYTKRFKPRGIERHILINKIFSPEKDKIKNWKEEDPRLTTYFKDRFNVELIISFLQSDGILNARQIVEERSGKYFQLYKEKRAEQNEEVVLSKMCERMGLKLYKGFVYDTFCLESPNDFSNDSKLYENLYKKLSEELSTQHKMPDFESDKGKDLLAYLEKIKHRNLLKITPRFSHVHNHLFSLFREEQILNTTLAWIYRYRWFFERCQDWDLLLAISEKGRFLNEDLREKNLQEKKFELILASFDLPDFQDVRPDKFANLPLLSNEVLKLPWWLHNQHMVLFLKKKSDQGDNWRQKWMLQQGFYYQSRVLSRRVNPVHITNEDDKERLLYIFANYWCRARAYVACEDQNKAIPIIANREEMDRQVEALLALYDK